MGEPFHAQRSMHKETLLIHIKSNTPGSTLEEQQSLGLNIVRVAEQGRMLSWAPLTLDYTWDSPTFWGLIRLIR
jgi:hypothetical protein